MKLYSIIYTNEAARTAEEALNNEVFAYHDPEFRNKVILISRNKILQAIDSVKKTGLMQNFFSHITKNIAQEAIVGYISFSQNSSIKDLYKGESSAAVDGFGPLMYQLAMYVIHPSWLMSDSSLKPASHRVWQKMYEFSEQGVYERKFLAEYKIQLIYNRRSSGLPDDANRNKKIEEYITAVQNNDIPKTEDAFIEWVKENLPEEPIKNFGHFWAYRKTSHDPKIKNLFDQGEKFIEQLKAELKISKDSAREIIEGSATQFFRNLYDSAASD